MHVPREHPARAAVLRGVGDVVFGVGLLVQVVLFRVVEPVLVAGQLGKGKMFHISVFSVFGDDT